MNVLDYCILLSHSVIVWTFSLFLSIVLIDIWVDIRTKLLK